LKADDLWPAATPPAPRAPPHQHHDPSELHATIAARDGGLLTSWDVAQWVYSMAEESAGVSGIPAPDARDISQWAMVISRDRAP
jgi:xanthine dehydrogenase YagR molybdenum-binding subunit